MSAVADPFSGVIGQPRVVGFLKSAVASDKVSHAYLFLGAPGSGKTDAAYAFSSALLCPDGGCGSCDTCVRIAHRTHPDVRYLAPEGVSGYVVSQIRELVHDCSLAPIRADRKIYIIDRADLLQGAPANAFLKTLEEPPDDVIFLLLGRNRDAVLSTILSRCQVIPFRKIPTSEASRILVSVTGASESDAAIALASAAGSLVRARSFLLSPSRKAVRKEVLAVLDRLQHCDDLDVLEAAKGLIEVLKEPLADVRSYQEQAYRESAEYLAKGALKSLEERQKRELTAREREGMGELFAIARSWLRDCIMVLAGTRELVVNVDDYASLVRVSSHTSIGSLAHAIEAVDEASGYITYNVTPQLVIETMLFRIREVIACPT